MYVTRPLSLYRRSPSALLEEPAEGPFSGFMVVTDDEAEEDDTFCFGACKRREVKRLPFPQDKILSVVHSFDYRYASVTKTLFIPVLDQPLSSNRYYVVRASGKYKGLACVCSSEMENTICCFSSILQNKKPKPLDPTNIYQTFKICRHHSHTFFAKSIAPDGTPPSFLEKKGWEVRSSKLYRTKLKEVLGLDEDLRSRLPSFDFSASKPRSGIVTVGEWYCPFVFVKEACSIRRQMKRSVFYKMVLGQYWERIHYCDNPGDNANRVNVNVSVMRETSYVMGMEAQRGATVAHGKFFWYRSVPRHQNDKRRASLGLSLAIVEKMKRILEEGGWFRGGAGRFVRVEREEEYRGEGSSGWRRFGCYVLVESFCLRRLDGTLLLKCDYRHTNRVRCKWE